MLTALLLRRCAETLRACGKNTDFLEVEWGKAVKPEMIAEKLDSGEYDTLTVCHNESSTGVRNPITEIGKLVRKKYPNVIYAIDAVSSLAGDKTLPQKSAATLFLLQPKNALLYRQD